VPMRTTLMFLIAAVLISTSSALPGPSFGDATPQVVEVALDEVVPEGYTKTSQEGVLLETEHCQAPCDHPTNAATDEADADGVLVPDDVPHNADDQVEVHVMDSEDLDDAAEVCHGLDTKQTSCSDQEEGDASSPLYEPTSTLGALIDSLNSLAGQVRSNDRIAVEKRDWSVNELEWARSVGSGQCDVPKPACATITGNAVCGKPLNKKTAKTFPTFSLKQIFDYQANNC